MDTLQPLPHTPAPSGSVKPRLLAALSSVLPRHAVLSHDAETTPYECDGLTAYRQRPLVVALPETEAQVGSVLEVCHALQVPVVARGPAPGCPAARCRMRRESRSRWPS